MIEFFVFGFFLTMYQYNRFITKSYEIPNIPNPNCSIVSSDDKNVAFDNMTFNRYDLLTVPLYITFFSIFYMVFFMYLIHIIDSIIQYFSTNDSSVSISLVHKMFGKLSHYDKLFDGKVSNSIYIMKILAVMFGITFVVVHLIILFRSRIYETKKEIVKRDFNGLLIILFISMFPLIIFI